MVDEATRLDLPDYSWLLPPSEQNRRNIPVEVTTPRYVEPTDVPTIPCTYPHCTEMFLEEQAMLAHRSVHGKSGGKPKDKKNIPATYTAKEDTMLKIMKQFFRDYKTRSAAGINRPEKPYEHPHPQDEPLDLTVISSTEETIPSAVAQQKSSLRRKKSAISTKRTKNNEKLEGPAGAKRKHKKAKPLIKEDKLASVENKPAKKENLGRIRCAFNTCKERFPDFPEMHLHLSLHGPFYICTHCRRAFAKPSQLNFHQLVLLRNKPYQCLFDLCGKFFSLPSDLKEHAASVHFNYQNPYVCPVPVCGEEFPTRQPLAEHMYFHAGT